jgi:cytochrome c oxidase subunit IV
VAGHAHTANPRADVLKYTGVLGTLLILTFITVGASYVNFGNWNVVIAIVIATMKASLVALFFMHLIHDKPTSAVIFLISVLFLALFLISVYTDYAERDPLLPSNYKLPTAPPAGSPASGPPPAPSAH